jgi:hypothetical protein
MQVDDAVCNVVKASPVVRRLVEDYGTAKRSFEIYHATLVTLALRGCILADLVHLAPSQNETRYADIDPNWLRALEALKADPDAALPG